MTTSQKSSRKISLEMKSEVHYKKAAKIYRKSQQYIKMINLYPTLQNTLIELDFHPCSQLECFVKLGIS